MHSEAVCLDYPMTAVSDSLGLGLKKGLRATGCTCEASLIPDNFFQ